MDERPEPGVFTLCVLINLQLLHVTDYLKSSRILLYFKPAHVNVFVFCNCCERITAIIVHRPPVCVVAIYRVYLYTRTMEIEKQFVRSAYLPYIYAEN